MNIYHSHFVFPLHPFLRLFLSHLPTSIPLLFRGVQKHSSVIVIASDYFIKICFFYYPVEASAPVTIFAGQEVGLVDTIKKVLPPIKRLRFFTGQPSGLKGFFSTIGQSFDAWQFRCQYLVK
jgi:hypothetical protein